MEVLFNKSENGQTEITELLGFLSSDFKYERLKTDIELNTDDLIDIISQAAYDKVVAFYKKEAPTEVEKTQFSDVLKFSQLYIVTKSYHDYSANNDLTHSTSGRKTTKSTDEATPWDWQIDADNKSQIKRAYKILDRLIKALDKSELEEWKTSDAYLKAKSLFVYKTSIFDDHYPIDKSAQLYYRMVSFMQSFERTKINPRLGETLYKRLKDSITQPEGFTALTIEETKILNLVELSCVYLTVAKSYRVFPVEMFPNKSKVKERTKEIDQGREELILSINKDAKQYLLELENAITEYNESKEEFISHGELDTSNLLPGLNEDQKYIDL